MRDQPQKGMLLPRVRHVGTERDREEEKRLLCLENVSLAVAWILLSAWLVWPAVCLGSSGVPREDKVAKKESRTEEGFSVRRVSLAPFP